MPKLVLVVYSDFVRLGVAADVTGPGVLAASVNGSTESSTTSRTDADGGGQLCCIGRWVRKIRCHELEMLT